MEISYQHANPWRGNESYLLRVRGACEGRTPCVLVDAGEGVDVDALLGDDEYLAAVLLTHAHVDHYRSLDDAHRDGAPVLAAPDTAAMLADVLAAGERHYGVRDADVLLEHVVAVDDRETVADGTIEVRPVPAGHAPGACGFLVRVRDGDEAFTALATGDFTRRDAAGYPGFDPERYVDVDALFLTAATDEEFGEVVTDVVATLARRASEGSTTLCTASGLTGVHLAALLAAVDDAYDPSVPVVLAGQVAKLYEALGYDHPSVDAVPTFDDPRTCLDPGTVTIAGPEVPVEGSSESLYRAIERDPNATLVQVTAGATTPKDAGDASGTVVSRRLSNHPSEATVDEVVEAIAPTHVVVEHQRPREANAYKDQWDAFTWATGNRREHVLYRDGSATAPEWVGERARRRVRTRGRATSVGARTDGIGEALSPPRVGRRDRLDLAAEGVDVDALAARLRTGEAPATPTSSGSQAADEGATPSSPEEPTPSSPAGGERPAVADGGLYRTVGPDVDAPDSLSASDEDDGSAPGDLFDTVRARLRETDASTDDADGGTAVADDGRDEGVEATASSDADDGEAAADDGSDVADDPDRGRANAHAAGDDSDDRETESGPGEVDRDDGTATTVEVDPALRALADRRAAEAGRDLDALVVDAVERLLGDVLGGELAWGDVTRSVERRSIDVDLDPALDRLVDLAAEDAGRDRSAFVARTVLDAVGLDESDRRLSVRAFDAMAPLVDALVENEACPLETRDAVVQAALERDLLASDV